MARLLLSDVLRWTAGQLLPGSASGYPDSFSGLSTDSRTIRTGSLFLALCGQSHNGHDYLDAAVAAGADGLVISDRSAADRLTTRPGLAIILVSDTLKALQDIAAGYRTTLTARVIGISGSVGKTSTRQMVSACLQPALSVHQTAGNLNNEIGLPQTLLQAEPGHQAVVLEMGMRGPGEISLLSRIARPDIALLTCIGYSHIGRLGSQAAILAAKTEIVDGLRPDGLLILNGEDPLLLDWGRSQTRSRRLAWTCADPGKAAGLSRSSEFVICAEQVGTGPDGSHFWASLWTGGSVANQTHVNLPFPGEHHVYNALSGLATAYELGVDLAIAAGGAAMYQITGNRQRLIEQGGCLIMDDSYNASPESMQAALRTIAVLARGRRLIAALGCMLELGDFAASAHYELGRQVAALGFARLLATGPNAADIVAGARSADPNLIAETQTDNLAVAAALIPALQTGDCLLVKGSRGFAMEKVTEAVLRHLAEKEQRT